MLVLDEPLPVRERPLSFHFVPHGGTEYTLRGLRCGGDVDAPLSADGAAEAAALRRRISLERPKIDRLLASPLQRCAATAAPIVEALGVETDYDSDLDERRMGSWNGRGLDETSNAIAVGLNPPGGESEVEFRTRVARVLAKVQADSRRTLIVSSSSVANVLHSMLGGAGEIALPNAQLIVFRAGYGADVDCLP